jgi:inner membrane protein
VYRNGHYGAALLCYVPVGFTLLAAGFEGVAAVGGALSLGLARAPDIDLRLPLVSHRGITHTLWFVVFVAALCGAAGWVLATPLGLTSPRTAAVFAGGIAGLSVTSHLLADVITPSGITPLWPLSGSHVTFDIVRADNWIANQVLLALGVFSAVAVTAVTNPGLLGV